MVKNLNIDFTLNNCLFEYVKLNKNLNPEKWKYSSCNIGFHSRYLSGYFYRWKHEKKCH